MKAKKINHFLNEIGEGNIQPYEYFLRYSDVLNTYIVKFKTESGLDYFIHLNPIVNYLEVDFGVEEEDVYKEVNKGELFKVISTVVSATEEVLNTHPELKGIRYDPQPKGGVTFSEGDRGELRNKLYKKFIEKKYPNAEFMKSKQSPTRYVKIR